MTISLLFFILAAACFFLKGINRPILGLDLFAMGAFFVMLGVIF